LDRTLEALKVQSLSKDQWELLLIDNASNEPISEKCNLTWHPNAHHIFESKLGLFPARLRGIGEARAELLLFVDDDNVLNSEYLKNALDITISHPWIGCFGGSIFGEFETPPPDWLIERQHQLAIFPSIMDEWAYGPGLSVMNYIPPGAGMLIRKKISLKYLEISRNDKLRNILGRKGSSLASAEDGDMSLTSCMMGFAVGRFSKLKMTHLIPSRRVQLDYMLKLNEEMECSYLILRYIWEGIIPEKKNEAVCKSEKIFNLYKKIRNLGRIPKTLSISDEFELSRLRGELKAIEILITYQKRAK
jgi:glycosyltransferase involved in cell wall biosynthesis